MLSINRRDGERVVEKYVNKIYTNSLVARHRKLKLLRSFDYNKVRFLLANCFPTDVPRFSKHFPLSKTSGPYLLIFSRVPRQMWSDNFYHDPPSNSRFLFSTLEGEDLFRSVQIYRALFITSQGVRSSWWRYWRLMKWYFRSFGCCWTMDLCSMWKVLERLT